MNDKDIYEIRQCIDGHFDYLMKREVKPETIKWLAQRKQELLKTFEAWTKE